VFLVAADHPFRVSVAAIAVALAVLAMVSAAMLAHGRLLHASAGSTAFNGIAAGLAMVSAWAIGRAVRQRRAYAQGQREEQARLAHRELAEARRQVTEERIRIARELHDVVAHTMSVIAVQAGVGGHVIDTQPAQARIALDVIETTTRQALTEMRHLLGVLRQQDAESGESDGPDQQADPIGSAVPAAASTRARPALVPAPSLADLDQLLAQTARAGVLVHFQVNGLRRELPTGIELTAYRIVQEALTNVVRHAGVPSCTLTLGYWDSELRIDIADTGPRDARQTSGALRAGGAPLAGARQSGGALRAGHGIIGMRERVSLHGGHFSAAPLPGAGFRVTARLPLDGGEQ
jgi:signal transduction histidine kinase